MRCAEHPSLRGSTKLFTWNPPPKFSSEDLPHESAPHRKVSSKQNQANQKNVTSVQNRSRENKASPSVSTLPASPAGKTRSERQTPSRAGHREKKTHENHAKSHAKIMQAKHVMPKSSKITPCKNRVKSNSPGHTCAYGLERIEIGKKLFSPAVTCFRFGSRCQAA